MKKLILIVVCLIAFFLYLNKDEKIKIIGFYQNIDDDLKNNVLYFSKDKKAAYYEIFIYDIKNNLLDIKRTTNNYYILNYIKNLTTNMYIKVISYNNKYEEQNKSDNYYIKWQYPFLKIEDNKVLISNKQEDIYEIIIFENETPKIFIKDGIDLKDYENAEILLYQNKNLINKLFYYKNADSKIIYPLNETTINFNDFYIKNDSNYECDITLTNKNKKIVLKKQNTCEYLVQKKDVKKNQEYELKIAYHEKESYLPLEEEIINFRIADEVELIKVTSNIKSGEVLKNSQVQLKSPNGVDVYYTLDGSIPNSKSLKYEEPIKITDDLVINALAINNSNKSAISIFEYKAIEKKPTVYLSPSRQTQNIGVARAGYTTEKIEMNKLAAILEKKLKEIGINVYLAPQSKDLNVRVKESNNLKSDIYLALHSNATTSGFPLEGKGRGIQSYIARPESSMLEFAKIVQSELMSIYEGPTNRSGVKFGTQTKMMYEINEANVKNGILLEIGFHDNYDDAYWIVNNLEEIAEKIKDAIVKYFKI